MTQKIILNTSPEEKKPTSRCLCGASVRSCSCVISHRCLWVQKCYDTREDLHLLFWAGGGRAQSALETYPNLAINFCTSDLIFLKKRVFYLQRWTVMKRWIHFCRMITLVILEICIQVKAVCPEKKIISLPTQRFQYPNSRECGTLEGNRTSWKESTDSIDDNSERFQGPWSSCFLSVLPAIILLLASVLGPWAGSQSLSAGLGTCRWEKSQESPPALFSTSGTRI